MALLVRAASPIWRLIIICVSVLGGILLVGGILLAVVGRSAQTTIKMFGNELSSTSVGVALAFTGAILVGAAIGGVLTSLNKVTGGGGQSRGTASRDTESHGTRARGAGPHDAASHEGSEKP